MVSPASAAELNSTSEQEKAAIVASSIAPFYSQTYSVPELVEPVNPTVAIASEAIEAAPLQVSSYDVTSTIALAESEIGTSRPTGWNGEGECIMSVGRWLRAGGADISGIDPVHNFKNFHEVALTDALPGDVIQYESLSDPTSWDSGVHTLLITGVNKDGTLTIIESNNPGGSGLVQKQENWLPTPPAGFRAVIWRFN